MSGTCREIDSRIEAVYQALEQDTKDDSFTKYLFDENHEEVKQFRDKLVKRPFQCELRFALVHFISSCFVVLEVSSVMTVKARR